jgi:NhaP-type Na+/H+ or K+/H+ antiporter
MTAVWYLLAIVLGGLALVGLQRIAHYSDVATLTGDVGITVLCFAGAWGCLRRVAVLRETPEQPPQD